MVDDSLLHYIKLAEFAEFIYNGNSHILVMIFLLIIIGLSFFTVAISVSSNDKISFNSVIIVLSSLITSAIIIYYYVSVPKPGFYYAMAYKELKDNNLTENPSYNEIKSRIEKYLELENEYFKKMKEQINNDGRAYYDSRPRF